MPSTSWLDDLGGAVDDPVRWAFLTGAHLLEAGRASLLLRDGSAPVLIAAAAIGIDPEIVPTIRVTIGRGIAGVVAERAGLLVGTRQNTTFISAPIITDGRVGGVLNLTNRLSGEQYGDEHVTATMMLTKHLAQLLAYRRMAVMDSASEPSSRQVFGEALDRELARSKRAGSPFSVAMIEVVIPQTLMEGTASNQIERAIHLFGEGLRRSVRRYDVVSRYGKLTFALLLATPSDPESGIHRRVAEVAAEVSRHVDFEIAVHVGLAHCPTDSISAHDLVTGAYARLGGDGPGQRISPTG